MSICSFQLISWQIVHMVVAPLFIYWAKVKEYYFFLRNGRKTYRLNLGFGRFLQNLFQPIVIETKTSTSVSQNGEALDEID